MRLTFGWTEASGRTARLLALCLIPAIIGCESGTSTPPATKSAPATELKPGAVAKEPTGKIQRPPE